MHIGQAVFTDFVLVLPCIHMTSNIYDFTHGLYFGHESPISLIYMLLLDIDPRREGTRALLCQCELHHNIGLTLINRNSQENRKMRFCFQKDSKLYSLLVEDMRLYSDLQDKDFS